MRILIFSPAGDGVGLAHQLQAENHQVAIHFVEEADAAQGKGMLWISQDWQADARQADFVIFDNGKHGEKADNLRRRGIKVWGGGAIADRLEMDRKFGMAVMRKAGIPIPPTWDFGNYAEAKKIVEAEFEDTERPVIKMNDNAGCATSYIGVDKEDLLHTIEAWDKEKLVDLSKGGIIQKKIEGVEVSVEGWFNGERFMYPYNITMEDKKLLNGNVGPSVGCAFSYVRQLKARHPRIAKEFLEPVSPVLRKASYTGQLDVNMIVDQGGKAYALEWTPRPGYEGTSNLVLGLPGYGEAVARTLGLSEPDNLVSGANAPWDHLLALRLYLPPYPFEAKTKPMAEEVYGCLYGVPVKIPDDVSRFVPYDICKNGDDQLIVAGTCGVPGIALGRGRSLDAAIRQMYDVVEEVEIPNVCYRTDGGDRVKEALPVLERSGLLS